MTPESDWKAPLGAVVTLHEAPKTGPHRRCQVEARRVTEYRSPERGDYREYGVRPLDPVFCGLRLRPCEAGLLEWVDGSKIEVEQP
jgi:hypothetical protein